MAYSSQPSQEEEKFQPTGALVLPTKRALPWYVQIWVQLVREKPLGTAGAVILLVLALGALFAPWLAPYPYDEVNILNRMKGYSPEHLLGTDPLGRDLLSRIIYGARVSLTVGISVVVIGKLFAVTLGTLSGYFGGRFDLFFQRIVDAWMSFPSLIILLTIMAVLGPGIGNIILALSLSQSFASSRVIRGSVLSIKEAQYIEAARAIGCGHGRIIILHIIPNIMAPIIVLATVALGGVILTEASLSFLGYGIPPPHPTWGGMLSSQAIRHMMEAPWLAIWPGLALSLAVFGINMLGDGLRDVLDPRLRGFRAARFR